jgi:hypothetical protein
VQTQLTVDNHRIWDLTQEAAPLLFADVMAPDDAAGYASACTPVMESCLHSALNPFTRGVEANLSYGSYFTISPSALQAYYSNNFLGSLAACAGSRRKCNPREERGLQAACLACYCHGLSAAAAAGDLEYDFYQGTTAKERCSALTTFDKVGTGLSIGSAVVIALVNAGLSLVIPQLVQFERQRSHSAQQRSLCMKVFMAQYINTSITPLIVSAEIKWLSVFFGGIVFQWGYPDFTTNWCASLCTSLVATHSAHTPTPAHVLCT